MSIGAAPIGSLPIAGAPSAGSGGSITGVASGIGTASGTLTPTGTTLAGTAAGVGTARATPSGALPATPVAFQYFELWTAFEANNGTRLGFFLPVKPSRRRRLNGDDLLTFGLVKTHRLAALIDKGLVIREVLSVDGLTVREWLIDSYQRGLGPDLLVTVNCVNPMTLLTNYPVTITDADGFVYTDVPAIQLPPATIIGTRLLAATPAFIGVGTVTPTTNAEIPFSQDSALSGGRRMEQLIRGYEFSLRKFFGSLYLLDFTALGSDAPTLYIRTAKNLRTQQKQGVAGQVTRVNRIQGAGGDDGPSGLQWAYWEVVSISGGGPYQVVLKAIHGGDGPIQYDNQLNHALLPDGANSLYLERRDGTTTQITGSVASTQAVTVASSTNITAGDWVRIVASAAGKQLMSLDAPIELALNGVIAGTYQSAWDDTLCVVRNGLQEAWAGTLPDGWTGLGGKTTLLNEWLTSGAALAINQAVADGAQLAAPPARAWYIKRRRTTYSAVAWIRLRALLSAGTITFQVRVNGVVVGIGLVYQTPANVWQQIKINGLDLSPYVGTTVTLTVEIVKSGGAGSVNMLVDSINLTPTLNARAVTTGSNAARIWQGTNGFLDDNHVEAFSYPTTVTDLARLGLPSQVPIVLGGTVVVANDEDPTLLTTRIVEISDAPDDPGSAALTLSTLPPRLSRQQSAPLALTIPFFAPIDVQVATQAAGQGAQSAAMLLRARTTASDATTVTVALDVQDTLGGSPKVTHAEFGAVYVSGAGAGPYVFTRPAVGAGTGRVVFTATLQGRTDVYDSLDVTEQLPGGGLIYNQTGAAVTAITPSTITVTVTALVATGTPQVKLVAITGSTTLNSGAAIGTLVPNGSSWVFNRGAFGAGVGQVQFRAVTPGAQDDDDYVDIAEVGRDTVALVSRARVTASTAFAVTVRYAVADPYPQGAASVAVAYQQQGTGGVAPASPGTVTPGATLTEAVGTYIDYTIQRPLFAAGTGRVTFTATNANRVSDSDAVDIPAQERDTITPIIVVTPGTMTALVQPFTITAQDPTSVNIPALKVKLHGCTGHLNPAGANTVIAVDTLTTIAQSDVVAVDRPAFNAAPASATFTADLSGTGGGQSVVQRTILNQDPVIPTTLGPTLSVKATPSVLSYSIAYSGDSVLVSIDGGAFGSPATATPLVVTRNATGGADKSYTFQATKDGQSINDTVIVGAVVLPPIFTSLTSVVQHTIGTGQLLLTINWTLSYAPSGYTAKVYGRSPNAAGETQLSSAAVYTYAMAPYSSAPFYLNYATDATANAEVWSWFFRVEIYDAGANLLATACITVPFWAVISATAYP